MHPSQRLFDKLSISASMLCAFHCAALPIILATFPMLSFLPSNDHTFHLALIAFIAPMSFMAAFIGCKKHRDKLVFAGITLGILMLVVAALFGHDLLGENGEKFVTVLATILLALSHLRNYKLCRKHTCRH